MAKPAHLSLILVVLLSFTIVDSLSVIAQDETLPEWNADWPYHQELSIPISTNSSITDYQPIDM